MFELFVDILDHNLIFQPNDLGDPFVNPWLEHAQLHLFHIDLLVKLRRELDLFAETLVLVREPAVLVSARSFEESCVRHWDWVLD